MRESLIFQEGLKRILTLHETMDYLEKEIAKEEKKAQGAYYSALPEENTFNKMFWTIGLLIGYALVFCVAVMLYRELRPIPPDNLFDDFINRVGIVLFLGFIGVSWFVFKHYYECKDMVALKGLKTDRTKLEGISTFYPYYNAINQLELVKKDYQKALLFLPENYRKYEVAVFADKAIKNGLASDMREIILLYEQFLHYQRVENKIDQIRYENEERFRNIERELLFTQFLCYLQSQNREP